MAELDDIRNAADDVADNTFALVKVADEGLKGAQAGLGRIAEGVDGLRAVVPDIGQAIGAAVAAALAPTEGKSGRDGIDGTNGLDGALGRPGTNGKPGRDGVDGIDGLPGRSGKAGAKGDQGPRGFDGPPSPGPVRVVAERVNHRLEAALVYLDDGSVRRMAARRDASGRISEFVKVPA